MQGIVAKVFFELDDLALSFFLLFGRFFDLGGYPQLAGSRKGQTLHRVRPAPPAHNL